MVWFGPIPLELETRRIFVMIWATVNLALWAATVVMASAWVKGFKWLVHPLGMLAVASTIAVGIAGFFQGSGSLFCGVLGLSVAASLLSLYEAKRVRRRVSFCRGFAVGIWVGVALILIARAPVTGTLILQVMWWDVSEWSGGLSWNGAAYQGVSYLLLTWFFAFCVGWLADLYEGGGKADCATANEA